MRKKREKKILNYLGVTGRTMLVFSFKKTPKHEILPYCKILFV